MRLKYTQFMYISQYHLNYNTGSIDRVDERRTWFKKFKHYYLLRTLVYNYPILLINTLCILYVTLVMMMKVAEALLT
jgi:hypothetical protein